MCDFIKFKGTLKKHETSLKFRYIFPKNVFLIYTFKHVYITCGVHYQAIFGASDYYGLFLL